MKELRKPRAGIVITGNEVYHGRVRDAFAPIIAKKIEAYGGEIVATYFAPDDETFIEERLRELLKAGADLLITTGGMSVDPDDVTRFAIKNLGATDITHGSAVLPGAMFLVAYLGIEHSAEGMGQEPCPAPHQLSALCCHPHPRHPRLRHVSQGHHLRSRPSAHSCGRADRKKGTRRTGPRRALS